MAENENKTHGDIPIEFDNFDPKRVQKVYLSELVEKSGHISKSDGYVLYNLFTEDECKRVIDVTNEIGYESLIGYDKNFRDNLRIRCKSTTIIPEMKRRISSFINSHLTLDNNVKTLAKGNFHNDLWKFAYLNPILRFCKYNPSNKFKRHYDSGFNPDPLTERTFKTCMVYLNEDYNGGKTRFYYYNSEYKSFLKLKAKAGMCLIFNQNIPHDGEQVENGYKYMMRTDMIYKAVKLNRDLTEDEKKGIELYKKAHEEEQKSNFIASTKLFEEATDLCPDAYLMINY